MTTHDWYSENAAAYVVGALERDEVQRFEAHLDTCARCGGDVAGYRQAVLDLSLSLPQETPPAWLRARTLAIAAAEPRTPATTAGTLAESGPRLSDAFRPWLSVATAASVVLALGIASYAWTLRRTVSTLRGQLAVAVEGAEALRRDLLVARRDAERALTTTNVAHAPDLLAVSLRGQAGARRATGRALLSSMRGLVFVAEGLPALGPGRVYQLWVIPPPSAGASPAPASAGILSDDGAGTFMLDGGPLPANARAVRIVAVTEEPAPSGSPGPTSPILLLGQSGG
jgi:anti-sigma-K factor RskA